MNLTKGKVTITATYNNSLIVKKETIVNPKFPNLNEKIPCPSSTCEGTYTYSIPMLNSVKFVDCGDVIENLEASDLELEEYECS